MPIVGRGDQGRVTDGGPHQPPEMVGEAARSGSRRRWARRSIPSASQPFQGKSFSFTVRINIGELKPVIGVVADVLDAGGEHRVEVFPLHRVAGHQCAAAPVSAETSDRAPD